MGVLVAVERVMADEVVRSAARDPRGRRACAGLDLPLPLAAWRD
jgi:hypothetical protein